MLVRGSWHPQTDKKCNLFKTYAGLRAGLFAKITRLNAAAATKHALAAFVVAPSGTWLRMIQRHVSKLVLCTRETNHTPKPATGLCAWCTA